MQLYHFTNCPPDSLFLLTEHVSTITVTRAEAKREINTVPAALRPEYFVHLVEVNGKEQIVQLANGHRHFKVLKRWRFTARGGLKECDAQGHYLDSIGHVHEEEKAS